MSGDLVRLGLGAVALYATDTLIRPMIMTTPLGIWGVLFVQAFVLKLIYQDFINNF